MAKRRRLHIVASRKIGQKRKSLQCPLRRILRVLHRGSGILGADIVQLECGHMEHSFGRMRSRCQSCYDIAHGHQARTFAMPLFDRKEKT